MIGSQINLKIVGKLHLDLELCYQVCLLNVLYTKVGFCSLDFHQWSCKKYFCRRRKPAWAWLLAITRQHIDSERLAAFCLKQKKKHLVWRELRAWELVSPWARSDLQSSAPSGSLQHPLHPQVLRPSEKALLLMSWIPLDTASLLCLS